MKNSFKESKPESNQGSTIRLQETQGAEEQAKLQGHSHQNPECRKFIRAKKKLVSSIYIGRGRNGSETYKLKKT